MLQEYSCLQKLVLIFGLLPAQALAVLAVSKHVQLVQRRIACLVRNAFRIYRLDEPLGGETGEFFFVDVKNVSILSIARAPFIQLLRRDPRNCSQQTIENAGRFRDAASFADRVGPIAPGELRLAIRSSGNSNRK